MSQDGVSVTNVAKTYPGGLEAVRDVGFRVAPGEFLTLLGPSGCGKSTKHGQGVMTAMGLVPEVEKNGARLHGPRGGQAHARDRDRLHGRQGRPRRRAALHQRVAGRVKLTPAQWSGVREGVKRYVPAK